jgi:hypothetical protein
MRVTQQMMFDGGSGSRAMCAYSFVMLDLDENQGQDHGSGIAETLQWEVKTMGRKGRSLITVVVVLLWIGAGAGSALAQLGIMPSQPPQKPQPNVLCSAGGRFVFGQISDSAKDQFMLDTLTGRLWRISESGEVGLYLSPVPYRVKDGKYSPLPGDSPPDAAGRKEGGRK